MNDETTTKTDFDRALSGDRRALKRVIATLAERQHAPGTLIYGYHLSGAGPARFGWAWRMGYGLRYLGRTLADAFATLALLNAEAQADEVTP